MAGITLTSKTINSTYDSLLKLTDNDGLTASFKKITDGLGNDSGISINNAGNVQISGTLNVSGTTTIGSVLRGNATLTIDPAAHGDNTGLVVIAGDLQVDGTTTTINSTIVSLDDKNILLAADAANKAAANGAGITVETGTNDPVVTDATILYNGTDDTWDFNKVVTASSFTGDLTGDVTGNADTSTKWENTISLTLGDTAKNLDGSTDLTWTKAQLGITKANIDALNINADQLDGYGTLSSQNWFGGIPIVHTDGVMEIGKYIDFHDTDDTTDDFDYRLTSNNGSLSGSGDFSVGSNDITAATFIGDLQGNADTASSTTYLKALDDYVWSASTNGRDFNLGIQASFVSSGQSYPQFGSVVRIATYSGINDGGTAELYFPYSATYGGSSMRYRLGKYNNAGWTGWKTVIDSDNIGSQSVANSDTVDSKHATDFDLQYVTTNGATSDRTISFTKSSGTTYTPLTLALTTSGTSYVKQDFITDTLAASTAYIIAYGSGNAQDGSLAIKNNSSHTTTNGTAGDIWFTTGASASDRMRIEGSTGNVRISENLTVNGNVQVDDKITITGTNNNLVIDEESENTWHLYDTFQDNGIIIHSSTGGMEFQYNGVTELTIDGSGVVFNGTVDISDANLNIGSADIIFDTVSTNANRGLVWDVDGSYLSKLVSGGTNGGMVEIYTNMGDDITGANDVWRVKTGSTAAIALQVHANGDTVTGYDFTSEGYVQAYGYLYTRDNLRVLNAAGNGWTTWATRSNGNYNLNVGSVTASRINSTNASDTPDIIGDIPIVRKHDGDATNGADYLSSIDNLDTFILSKKDGGYGGGTKPSGSHNGLGIISMQTHTGNYYTQLGLSTATNDLFIRSANASTSFGTWYKIWHQNNDGSGSGLDADKLDGLQASQFLRSDANDTYTGTLTVNGNISFSGDSRYIDLSGGTTNSQNALIIGEQNLYGVRFRWDSGASLHFDGYWNTSTTGAENKDLGYVDVNNRIWYLNNSIQSNYIYVGSGGGYFYNDSGSRIRTNHDFYTNNGNTYLYSNNLYLGDSSGDTVHVRGNYISGYNWYIGTDGGARFKNIDISGSLSDTIQNKTAGGNLWLQYGHNGTIGLGYGGGKTTMYAKAEVIGTANGNDPTLKITSTTSNSFNHAIEAFNSNLTSGEANIVLFGKEGNTKNSGYIGYEWAGAGSNNNFVTIGHWGADHLFRVYPDQTTTGTSFRAPIFYDSNNTSYFLDPAGSGNSTVLNGVKLNYLGVGVSANTSGSYRLNMGGAIDMNAYDVNYVSQLHFNDNVRFYDDANDSYLNFKYGDASTGGIRFRNGGNTQKGYLYADNNGFGLLSADGTWAVQTTDSTTTIHHSVRSPIYYDSDNTGYYVNPASTSNFSRLDLQAYSFFNSGLQVKRNIGTTSPSWQDANHTFSLENSDAGYISINFHRAGYTSNNIYYTGSEIITDDTFRSTVDMRAPIYYDSDDTNWYVNPNSVSNLWNLRAYRMGITNTSSTSRYGISLYGGESAGEPTYGLLFTGTSLGTHGSVTGSWATYFTMNNDNSRGWIFRRVGSGNCASISGGGTASFNGDVIAYYSDMRLKTKLGDIKDPIGKIQALNGFYYEPNEVAQSYGYEKETRVGLSAQEVEAVLPEIVTDAPIGDGYKTVDYAKLVPVLVEAIKEQQKQIDELKSLINKS